MAAKCKKCDPHEICEECPEWIFTLADLIMCMMGLFVLLWVLKEAGSKAASPAQAQQIEQEFFRGFQQGFQGYIPTDTTDDKQILMKLNGPGEKGKTNTEQESPEGTEDKSSSIRPGQEVATGGRLQFEKGKDLITPAMNSSLDKIAELIRGHRQIVQVKGHTSRDDLGIDGTSATTMALSLRRAQAVANYLVSKGVEPEVIRVQGCGTFEPVKQGDSTTTTQALNRRVEIFSTAMLADDLQDRGNTARPLSTTGPEKAAPPAARH